MSKSFTYKSNSKNDESQITNENYNSQNSEIKSEYNIQSNSNKYEDSSSTKEDSKTSNNNFNSQNNLGSKENIENNNNSKSSNFNENGNNPNLNENSFDINKEEKTNDEENFMENNFENNMDNNMENNEEPKNDTNDTMNKEESEDSCIETTTNLANYIFYECDANYFKKELHFSQRISEKFSQSYCLNKSQYNSNINFTLSQVNPLGESNYELLFKFNQACNNEICDTNKETNFQNMIESIQTVKIFIKTYVPDPNNLENPIQSQINTFTLSPNHRGTTLYFKKYKIITDSSIIPYIVQPKEYAFIAFDYYEDNAEEDLTDTFFLRFVLSQNNSYLFRTYDKLDTILANFIGVLNALEFVGRFLSMIFYSFYNEIYIYNYILRDKIFINGVYNNNNNKKKKFNIYNTNINNNCKRLIIDVKEKNDYELKNLEKNDKKILCLNKLSNDLISNSVNDSNTVELKNAKNLCKRNENSKLSFLSNNINIKRINNINITDECNKNEYKKNDNDFIKLSFIQNLYTVLLISCNSYHSKYKVIDNIIKRIKLVQNLYDTAIYINNILDVMKIKKILFNQEELMLFNSMQLSFDEVHKNINNIQNNEEFINKKVNSNSVFNKSLTKIIRNKSKNNIINIEKNNYYSNKKE